MSDSLRPHELYSPWNSPGQNPGAGSRSLLQGIFPTQGSNPGLPHCRWILYHLSHQGSLRILVWVTHPFSRGSSYTGIEPGSPALQANSLSAELSGKPWGLLHGDDFKKRKTWFNLPLIIKLWFLDSCMGNWNKSNKLIIWLLGWTRVKVSH